MNESLLEFRYEFQIDLELSSDQGKPGDQVSITVSTKPNSYVGLLGVDQSVLLLKKGNDIEKSTVFEELGKYNEKTRYQRRWFGNYYGTYVDFEMSGAAIITNAKEEIRKFNPNLLLLLYNVSEGQRACKLFNISMCDV